MAAHAQKESLIMAHIKPTAALLLLGLSAAACAPAGERLSPAFNPTVYSVNQPVVQRTDYVIDLARAGRGISDPELSRLSQWFETLQLGYGDRVSVDSGPYDDPVARQDVAAVAAEFGLLLVKGAPVTAGSGQRDVVRVVVSRSAAAVPGCPNWGDGADIGGRISTSSNYGCSVNANLAAMIADPNDLVLGQTSDGVADPAESSKAIKSYRNRVMTGFEGLKSETTGGK
jgi:pilus assembly protein CpaD